MSDDPDQKHFSGKKNKEEYKLENEIAELKGLLQWVLFVVQKEEAHGNILSSISHTTPYKRIKEIIGE